MFPNTRLCYGPHRMKDRVTSDLDEFGLLEPRKKVTATEKVAAAVATQVVDLASPQAVRLNKKQEWAITFGAIVIPPGETIVATNTPDCLFRGDELINTGNVDGLYISGIFVGNMPQLPPNISPISVAVFQPSILNSGTRQFDTCQLGLTISIVVENRSSSPRTFAMTMQGHTIR